MQLKQIKLIRSIMIALLIAPWSQIEANNSIKDLWITVSSPVKVGVKSELRAKTKMWLHRPSLVSFLDVTEEYLPELPANIRLEAYCRDLKDQFKKIDSYKLTPKSCVVMGNLMDKPTLQGAFLDGNRNVRHFVGDLVETKFDKVKLAADLEELMKRHGGLK